MFIIMTGEPVNGFDYIGPFKYFTSAKEYANYYLKNDIWWIIKLTNPREDK
jgi:hypothetical protein